MSNFKLRNGICSSDVIMRPLYTSPGWKAPVLTFNTRIICRQQNGERAPLLLGVKWNLTLINLEFAASIQTTILDTNLITEWHIPKAGFHCEGSLTPQNNQPAQILHRPPTQHRLFPTPMKMCNDQWEFLGRSCVIWEWLMRTAVMWRGWMLSVQKLRALSWASFLRFANHRMGTDIL